MGKGEWIWIYLPNYIYLQITYANLNVQSKIYLRLPLFWGWALLLFLAIPEAKAQLYPYTVTFETGRTHPAVKSYGAADTVWCDSIPWLLPGTYLGTMTNNDFAIGNHAARMSLTNNTSGNPAYMEMLEDLPLGTQSLRFYTAMYGSDSGGQLLVLASTDSGQSWQAVGDTIDITATHDSAMTVTLTSAIQQPVRFKIQKTNTENNRIDVDSIVFTQFGSGLRLLMMSLKPGGSHVSIYTDSLVIKFDHPVQSAQGQLILHRQEGGQQTIDLSSSLVSLQDSLAIIKGIHLQDNSHYYVLLSDSAFADTVTGLYSMAVADSTFWHFTTEDTVMMPPIQPLQNLKETFLACNEAQNLMGMFKAFSRKGNQNWTCTSDGHSDSFAVAISGGFGQGLSAENEDWLISELPFGLSAMATPVLSFWQKGIYEGTVDRTVKISFDYPGDGFPFADSVHWLTLHIPGISSEPASDWEFVNGIDLSAFKDSAFYLAFTYACQTNGAYKLYYDDIRIQQENTGMRENKAMTIGARVLGFAGHQQLRLQIVAQYQAALEIYGYDLQGKILFERSLKVRKGQADYTIAIPALSAGMYFMKLESRKNALFLRFLVQ